MASVCSNPLIYMYLVSTTCVSDACKAAWGKLYFAKRRSMFMIKYGLYAIIIDNIAYAVIYNA